MEKEKETNFENLIKNHLYQLYLEKKGMNINNKRK